MKETRRVPKPMLPAFKVTHCLVYFKTNRLTACLIACVSYEYSLEKQIKMLAEPLKIRPKL